MFALVLIIAISSQCVGSNPDIDQYNIVWTSQSKDSSESMPVGGHDIGLNVWVEKGDLLFYAQRSGCFDENNEFLKLGRIRLQLDPNPFTESADFRQELKLRQGYAEIVGQKDDLKTTINIWVEVYRPVVHLDIQSSQSVSAEVAYEGWRNEDVQLPDVPGKTARFGCFGWDFYPGKVVRYADVVSHEGNGVLFYHRNKDDKLIFDYTVRQQGLESIKNELVNTQKGRTFGGYLTGEGFIQAGEDEGTYVITPYKAWKLRSKKPRKTYNIKLFSHLAQTETLGEWLTDLKALAGSNEPCDKIARKRTIDWWDAFWQRSWLMINPQKADPKSPVWQSGRNYQLFRYQLGCNAYGSHPTKFNGGNFTYDPSLVDEKRTFTPDWRPWGGGSITAMNQRLVHWPMLKSGDFDLMIPQFEFYRTALPNATARVKMYWKHDGCLFTEQLENFGLPLASQWGWTEPDAKGRGRVAGLDYGVQSNYPCRYHYLSQLGFAYMILEYHRYTDKNISQYMDFVKQSVKFFDEHYQMRNKKTTGKPLDENGKLVIFPSAGCETYKGSKNPTDILAGLNACVKGILMLSEDYISSEERAYYKGLLNRIPDYAYDQIQGDRVIKPAWSWEKVWNHEIPHLYTLFPFDQFVLGQDNMTVFRNTWKHDEVYPKEMVVSWHQDTVFLARMGMTQEAADFNTKRMSDSPRRFPTFWGGAIYDWLPDHNWGGVGMVGMQEMLMQTVGRKIRLLPAWPKEWDVDFKLHAPYKTTVQGKVRSGKLTDLKVTPKERLKDVIVMNTDHD